MPPIRWAASAPLLPPLRHLTRSIFHGPDFSKYRLLQITNGLSSLVLGMDCKLRGCAFISSWLLVIGGYNEFRAQRDLRGKCTMQDDTLGQHILISYPPLCSGFNWSDVTQLKHVCDYC